MGKTSGVTLEAYSTHRRTRAEYASSLLFCFGGSMKVIVIAKIVLI